MLDRNSLKMLKLPQDLKKALEKATSIMIPQSIHELMNHCISQIKESEAYEVAYDIPGKKTVKESYVCKVRNGLSVNYYEPYMRRRDPECMLIGDEEFPTDKKRYKDVYKKDFKKLRSETFDWLAERDLILIPFISGQIEHGIPTLAIVPANAAFFALTISLLQGVVDLSQSKEFEPKCFMYVAPPFRHTHFGGKQMVVHNRLDDAYEVFSYNLYPGPSAKKGVYGALIHFGEKQGWVTNHAAVVKVVTPYDNSITIMHEGASGGGKSEMNEHMHREYDGSILFSENVITGEKHYLVIPRVCNLSPVVDDMALAHSKIQKDNGKLTVIDAEYGWFIRVDHIKNYGTDPDIEARSIHPSEPLLFLNIDARPEGTALLWDHIEDEPGQTCPNPRFILPRNIVPDIINKPVNVDIRSFGVRAPLCTIENPSYGIFGLFHVLPPALAWLWRLVSPRGFANPSIVDTEGMSSEGVGSYWPFATGKKVTQANMLLQQIIDSPKVQYVLSPSKHIGAWKVGFMPQWIMREYIARRGCLSFHEKELSPARCSLLGYTLNTITVEGQLIEREFFHVEHQPEVGKDAYDKGAKMLSDFFKNEISKFLTDELDPLGRKIIELCINDGTIEEYFEILPNESLFMED